MDKSLCSSPNPHFRFRWQSTGPVYNCASLPEELTIIKGATTLDYNVFTNCAVDLFWCAGVTSNSGALFEQARRYPSAAAAIADLPNLLP